MTKVGAHICNANERKHINKLWRRGLCAEGDLLDFVDKLLDGNSNIIEEVAEENDIAIEEVRM